MASPDIFTFKRTMKETLDECMDVLCSRGVKVPASQVVNEWRFYMQQILEPCGWQALWKLSRMSCVKFGVQFPTFVYVEVVSTDLDVLCATVKILAVQDELSLPEEVQVPLQHLYPTKHQTNSVLDVEGTAKGIDQLRFFFDHLWQPWDIDDDDYADWPSDHLESRIQLYYDMQLGVVLRETGEHIRALLEESRSVQSQIAMLEETISDIEDICDDTAYKIIELNLRKGHIKAELRMFENPVMRNVCVRKRQEKALSKRGPASSKDVCFVWIGGTVDEFAKNIAQAKLCVESDAFIRCSSLLQEALDQAIAGDVILLCAGVHGLQGSGGLEDCVIRGTFTPSETTLRTQRAGNVLFDCSSNIVVLENLTVDSQLVYTVLLVRRGTLRLLRCHIIGEDMTSRGVFVLAGAKLEAVDCRFSGLETAVLVDNGGEVDLQSCTISNCKVGLQLCDNSEASLQTFSISGCTESGIQIKTSQSCDTGGSSKSGSVDLLDGRPKIKVEHLMIENNASRDVTLVKCDAVAFRESIDCFIGGVPPPLENQEAMLMDK